MEADEIPDEAAILLGRIVFYGGRVDTLLGKLVPPKGEQPGSRRLSGTQLTDALADHASHDPAFAMALAGYEQPYEWRNRIIHGALSFDGGILWIWHIPIRGRGAAAHSFQLRIADVERLAESWRNLADAAHALLHRNQPAALPDVLCGAAQSDFPDSDAIAHIANPSLVLSWAGDAGHPISSGELLASLLPNSRFEIAQDDRATRAG